MRFKAKLDRDQVSLLYSLIGPISRLKADAVLYLDPNYLRLSSRDADGISCFAELATKRGIFIEHRCESVADNAIVFEIDLNLWKMALQSILSREGETRRRVGRRSSQDDSGDMHMAPTNASSLVIMKLAKRQGGIPCLCMEACSATVELIHAIPVKIQKVTEMKQHLPPQIKMPNVQLELSSQRPLRTIVERLKSISPHVYLEGSMTGELTLRVDSDGASMRTFLTKLVPKFDDCKSQDNASSCTLKVDTKKLSTCLQWQATMNKTVSSSLLCMVENEMLVLHVVLDPGSVGFFTYYVPVHYLSDSQMD